MATQKIFSDIDLTFKRMQATGDVAMRYNDQAVISSVRNLLLTNFYERPFQPTVGSNLTALLFEPATNITASILSDEIKSVIKNYEPRAILNEIQVTLAPNQNAFNVRMSFFIGNNTAPTNVSLLLQRSR